MTSEAVSIPPVVCEHRENTDPRRVGSCVKCGTVMEVAELPRRVEEFFDQLQDALEDAGVKHKPPTPDTNFDYFRALTVHRVHQGQRLYRESWRDKDTIREAFEELSDCTAYAVAEMAKRGEEATLMDAVYHAYLAYVALRRYEFERDTA